MGQHYTKEQIEELKKRPYGELTSEERKIVNLNLFNSTDHRAKGREKGSITWSTRFQKYMEDAKLVDLAKKIKPGAFASVGDTKDKTPADMIAAGLIVNVMASLQEYVDTGKPLNKDVREAIALLNKIGYGDKVTHSFEDAGFFQAPVIKYEVLAEES